MKNVCAFEKSVYFRKKKQRNIDQKYRLYQNAWKFELVQPLEHLKSKITFWRRFLTHPVLDIKPRFDVIVSLIILL